MKCWPRGNRLKVCLKEEEYGQILYGRKINKYLSERTCRLLNVGQPWLKDSVTAKNSIPDTRFFAPNRCHIRKSGFVAERKSDWIWTEDGITDEKSKCLSQSWKRRILIALVQLILHVKPYWAISDQNPLFHYIWISEQFFGSARGKY